MKRIAAGLLLMGMAQSVLAVDADVQKVLDCMRVNLPETVQIRDLQLISRDRNGGERVLKARFYGISEKGLLRVMMRVNAPADLARGAYLLREGEPGKADETYIYVPSVNKVRRVVGASADGSLWGSDLSYTDIKQLMNASSNGDTKLEPEQKIEGRAVHVLNLVPAKEESVRYTGVRSFVDQKTCVPLKVEFTEATGLRKRLTVAAKDLKLAGTRWYAEEATMVDVKENTQTILKVLGVTGDKSISSGNFNPRSFYIGG